MNEMKKKKENYVTHKLKDDKEKIDIKENWWKIEKKRKRIDGDTVGKKWEKKNGQEKKKKE